jgi:hypothetical protein
MVVPVSPSVHDINVSVNISGNCNECCEQEKCSCCCFGRKITRKVTPQPSPVKPLHKSPEIDNLAEIKRHSIDFEKMEESKHDDVDKKIEEVKKKHFCVIM